MSQELFKEYHTKLKTLPRTAQAWDSVNRILGKIRADYIFGMLKKSEKIKLEELTEKVKKDITRRTGYKSPYVR